MCSSKARKTFNRQGWPRAPGVPHRTAAATVQGPPPHRAVLPELQIFLEGGHLQALTLAPPPIGVLRHTAQQMGGRASATPLPGHPKCSDQHLRHPEGPLNLGWSTLTMLLFPVIWDQHWWPFMADLGGKVLYDLDNEELAVKSLAVLLLTWLRGNTRRPQEWRYRSDSLS